MGKFVSVPNQVSRREDVLGCGGILPCILNFFTRLRLAVSFTPRPPYSGEKSSPTPIG